MPRAAGVHVLEDAYRGVIVDNAQDLDGLPCASGTLPRMGRDPAPERSCPRVAGFGAAILPRRQHVCSSCGEPVIYNRRLDDPPNLRLVCTVCLVSPP